MNFPSVLLKLWDALASATSFVMEFHSFSNTLNRKPSSFASFKTPF